MGVAGTDVALEAAHAALMREDWELIPELFEIAQRTMRVVKMNITFTVLYNLIGLSLAALGFLPPILAAAAQSLPDLGILANSSRLLRQKKRAIPHMKGETRESKQSVWEVSHQVFFDQRALSRWTCTEMATSAP